MVQLSPSNKGNIKKIRYWELDFARGIAIVAMVYYHIVYNLIKIFKVEPFIGKYFFILGPDIIGGSFLMIAGIAAAIKGDEKLASTLKRSGKIFGLGMILTVGSLIFTENRIIAFGILHCIGLSILLGKPFLKLSPRSLLIIALPILISAYTLEHFGYYEVYKIWLRENLLGGKRSADFFSFYPYFAYYLLGIFLGKTFWNVVPGKFELKKMYEPLIWMGKWSLWIYVIHQPVVIALIYLMRGASWSSS